MARFSASNALLLAVAVVALIVPTAQGQGGLIRVSNGQFVDDDCKPFVFSGYNTWEVLEAAAGQCCGGQATIGEQFDEAVLYNLTVIRMFAYGVLPDFQLQTGPGEFNETIFQAFDYVISEASKRNLKLLIALSSNWIYSPNQSDTKCWYTNLTLTADNCDDFFSDPNAINIYKQNVQGIMTRVNSITGVQYSEDPTIFGWDLMNEPRCESTTCTAADIQSWISTVAPYVKSLTKQLLTVGEDGFFQASNCQSNTVNPVDNAIGWPLQTGQDWLPNHAVDAIDFASIHMWPDNWLRTDLTFGKDWIAAHEEDAALLGKPMVIEEFGKAVQTVGSTATTGQGQTVAAQDQYYSLAYADAETSIDNNGTIKGIAFWRWAAINTPGEDLATFDNAATISTNSTAFTQTVAPFSQRVAALNAGASPIAGCTPVTSSVVEAPGAGTAPTTATVATSSAGRKLKQAAAPSPAALFELTINSEVTCPVGSPFGSPTGSPSG